MPGNFILTKNFQPKAFDELFYVSPITGYWFVFKLIISYDFDYTFLATTTETNSVGTWNGIRTMQIGEQKKLYKKDIIESMQLIVGRINYNSIWRNLNV